MQVITRLNVGGPARHVLELDAQLPSFGIRSSLVWGTEGEREGRLDPSVDAPGVFVPTLRRAPNPWRDARAYRTLRRAFERGRPDIVHTHTAKAGALGRVAARRAGIRVVVHTFYGHVLEGYFPKPVAKMFATVERAAARYADALVAVSPQVRDELLGLGIGRPERWHVMPLGLELGYLFRSTLSSLEARARLGLPAAGPIVGIVGRLAPIKDVGCFLDAAARIARVRADATFVVAGDGELRRVLEAKARDLLGGRVRFLGWVGDLEALYAALDVVVLTSLNEGTPVALIEAGAAGRPVVATRVGGVPDVVRNGVTGTLVPPRQPQGIATQVVQLLEHRDLAGSFGAAGRREIAQRFGGSEPVSYVAALYRRLLERAG